jgi:hypothetical protein
VKSLAKVTALMRYKNRQLSWAVYFLVLAERVNRVRLAVSGEQESLSVLRLFPSTTTIAGLQSLQEWMEGFQPRKKR